MSNADALAKGYMCTINATSKVIARQNNEALSVEWTKHRAIIENYINELRKCVNDL